MSNVCKHCGVEIRWAVTANGRPMPIDPEPVEDGNVQVLALNGRLHALVLRKGQPPDPRGTVHKAHFATCPKWPKREVSRRETV